MVTRSRFDPGSLPRRDAIHLLGFAGGLGVVASHGLLSSRAEAVNVAQAGVAPVPSGAIIRTILEDVPTARLTGMTLFHEHLSMSRQSGQPIFYDDTALIADEVRACAADGVSCIVDAGTAGLGRKIAALRTIAQRSGMLIVAGGGLHAKSDYAPDVFRKT